MWWILSVRGETIEWKCAYTVHTIENDIMVLDGYENLCTDIGNGSVTMTQFCTNNNTKKKPKQIKSHEWY